jgi:hypothetical protein
MSWLAFMFGQRYDDKACSPEQAEPLFRCSDFHIQEKEDDRI